MGKVTEDLKAAASKVAEAVTDEVHGDKAAAGAALAEAEKDLAQAGADVKDAAKAVVARVKGIFAAKFSWPLRDHTQDVLITPEGVEAEHTPWVQEQIEAGVIVKVEPAVEAAPAGEAPAPEAK